MQTKPRMEREESFRSFPDSISSTSDLSSVSFQSDYYDASDGRPLCEYEEFCTPSWRSVASWSTNESGSLPRVQSIIGPQASGSALDADALWEELQELVNVKQQIVRKLVRQGMRSEQIREARPWLRLVDDKMNLANKLQSRRNSWLFSWRQNRDVLKLKESVTTLGGTGKVLLHALSDVLIGQEHTLIKIGRLIGADGYRNQNIIGIKGGKGVGKTRILQEFLKEKSGEIPFDAVIWLTISFSIPTSRIQEDIAKQIDLSLTNCERGEQRRALLYDVLSNLRFLLVLDDLRGVVHLDVIGIPCPGVGSISKIVITSRSEKVCNDMGVNVVMDVLKLSEQQAWELFCNVVGDAAMEDPEVEELARMLVRRCDGLPSVLVGFGKAMRSVKSIDGWRHYSDNPSLLREFGLGVDEESSSAEGAVDYHGMVHLGGGRFYLMDEIDPKYQHLYMFGYDH